MYKIFIDGSTKIKNQKNTNNIGGFGYVVYNEEGHIIDAYSERAFNTTNNRMELMALYAVIQKYGVDSVFSPNISTVYTDSAYAMNCLISWSDTWRKNDWMTLSGKPVENQDIIIPMYETYWNDHFILIEKCKGHSGIEGNELADKLATGEITPEEVMEKYGN